MNKKLIFVYNADSGFFNTAADIAHKITSPDTYQCKLCALTHGYFKIKAQWDQYLKQQDMHFIFYHRDEFLKHYGDTGDELPAVFVETDRGVDVLLDKARIEELQNLDELIALIKSL
ncbi:MAG: GTPase [Gammaproteobacteria bacterium]|nr:GTPase [Gammaproteobacteria bacterium]